MRCLDECLRLYNLSGLVPVHIVVVVVAMVLCEYTLQAVMVVEVEGKKTAAARLVAVVSLLPAFPHYDV